MKIKGYEIAEETVMEIGKFTILWSHFEDAFFGNRCNAYKIVKEYKKFYIREDAQKQFADALSKRRDWTQQLISEYADEGLHPGNADQSDDNHKALMEEFMEQKGEDLRCGCLLIIHRIRNNMMHGLKSIEYLDDQLELFQAINAILESIN